MFTTPSSVLLICVLRTTFQLERVPAPGGVEDDQPRGGQHQGHHQDWRDSLQGRLQTEDLGSTKTWPLPDSTDSIPGANRAKRCRLTAEPEEPGLRGACWEMDPMILGDTRQGAKIWWSARHGDKVGSPTNNVVVKSFGPRGSARVQDDLSQDSLLHPAWRWQCGDMQRHSRQPVYHAKKQNCIAKHTNQQDGGRCCKRCFN